MNKLTYLIKGFPEWGKAKMVRFQLLNVNGTVTCYWINPSYRHFISMWNYFLWRTTSTTTISPAIRVTASFTSGCTPFRPVALSWLCLIEYLWNHKLSFFLFLILTKVVLMHDPVGLFRLSVFPKICVKDKYFLAPFLLAIHHYRPSLPSLVPPCFSTLQVTFGLNFSSLSCPSCVSFRWSMEEMPAQAISCDSYVNEEVSAKKSKLGWLRCNKLAPKWDSWKS